MLDVVLVYAHQTLVCNDLGGISTRLHANGTQLINASPFALGLLTKGGPPPWHKASTQLRKKCTDMQKMLRSHFDLDLSDVALHFFRATTGGRLARRGVVHDAGAGEERAWPLVQGPCAGAARAACARTAERGPTTTAVMKKKQSIYIYIYVCVCVNRTNNIRVNV